jgi:hypothetical protein
MREPYDMARVRPHVRGRLTETGMTPERADAVLDALLLDKGFVFARVIFLGIRAVLQGAADHREERSISAFLDQ